jgi:hypothetical protein
MAKGRKADTGPWERLGTVATDGDEGVTAGNLDVSMELNPANRSTAMKQFLIAVGESLAAFDTAANERWVTKTDKPR